MMKIKSFFWTLLLIFALTGCHKVTFVKPETSPNGMKKDQFHYNLIFSLIEYSDPVHFIGCNGAWSDVKTHNSFLSGLLGTLDNGILSGIDIVSVMEVEYQCAKQSSN